MADKSVTFTGAEVVRLLRMAPRGGQEKDEPEGARFVQISDTLANLMADTLERELAVLQQERNDPDG